MPADQYARARGARVRDRGVRDATRTTTTEFGSAEEAHIADRGSGSWRSTRTSWSEYLEKGADRGSTQARVHEAFEASATREGHLTPIVYASARTGAGIDQLAARGRVAACQARSRATRAPSCVVKNRLLRSSTRTEPTIAHVFRVTTEEHLGKLGVFRVHQGTVRARSELYIDGEPQAASASAT